MNLFHSVHTLSEEVVTLGCSVHLQYICLGVSYLIYSYLIAVVTPRSELHEARLLVERKVSHVDFTRRLKNCGRRPHHFACVVQNSLGHCGDHVLTISAETINHKMSALFLATRYFNLYYKLFLLGSRKY